jgi:hypothetical protein
VGRKPVLLWAGALLGMGLAAFGVLRRDARETPEPSGAVALVDGHALSREAFERLRERVGEARGSPVEAASEQRELLERMIDEELLLRHGLELDLVHVDPELRGALLRSVVGAIQGAAEIEEPEEARLREFYRAHAELVRAPPRFDVELLHVALEGRSESGSYRLAAELARRAREGETLAGLRAELGDAGAPPLPAPVTLDALAERLGPNAARAVAQLAPGEVSDPLRGSEGWWVIRLRERALSGELPFEEVRERVREAWWSERGEAALREYLERARAEAEIRILDPALSAP